MGLGVLFRTFKRFLADRRGATAAVITLMIVPLVAAVGMAVEGGGWYLVHRAAQNAADAASLAAAINECAPGDPCDDDDLSATYVEEAAAVAAKFGFVDDDTTDIATTMVNCPGTTDPECYQVMITKRFPLSLVRIVGFDGDATVDGQPAQTVSAVAIAMPPEASAEGFCMIGLATVGNAITLNGMSQVAPGSGCDLRSNSGLNCNGNNAVYFPDHAYSANGSNDCAAEEDREIDQGPLDPADPYTYAQSGIPASGCNGATLALKYPGATIPTTYTGGTFEGCGNTTLAGNITVTAANSIIVIRNGYLDLSNVELKTTGSGSLTIIFSGESVNGPPPAPDWYHDLRATPGGTTDKLTIRAPDSGPLRGVAIMQDSTLTGNKNSLAMDFSGNEPELTIQGLIYLPNGAITVGGAINFFNTSLHCIAIAAWNITISGTGAIANGASDDCVDAGLFVPTLPGALTRETLVQ